MDEKKYREIMKNIEILQRCLDPRRMCRDCPIRDVEFEDELGCRDHIIKVITDDLERLARDAYESECEPPRWSEQEITLAKTLKDLGVTEPLDVVHGCVVYVYKGHVYSVPDGYFERQKVSSERISLDEIIDGNG